MVSNVLEMDVDDLVAALKRIKKEYKDDPDYKELRGALPKTWPI